jgi:CDP-alcohol phosphatidyltransferase
MHRLDGYVARRFDQKSVLGSLLDPLADKVSTNGYVLTVDHCTYGNSHAKHLQLQSCLMQCSHAAYTKLHSVWAAVVCLNSTSGTSSSSVVTSTVAIAISC